MSWHLRPVLQVSTGGRSSTGRSRRLDVDSQLAEINLEALEPLGRLFFDQSDVTCVCGDWSPVWKTWSLAPTNVTPFGQKWSQVLILKFRGIKSQVKKTETMAQFVIGSSMVDDSVRKEKERKEQENQEKARRHYKKDSR